MGTVGLLAFSPGPQILATLGGMPAESFCLFQASPSGDSWQPLFLLVLERVNKAEFTLWFGPEKAGWWGLGPAVERAAGPAGSGQPLPLRPQPSAVLSCTSGPGALTGERIFLAESASPWESVYSPPTLGKMMPGGERSPNHYWFSAFQRWKLAHRY